MSKLTLSVDEAVVERAKRYAAKRGTSVSRLVETYLDLLSRPETPTEEKVPPILARLQGALKGVKFDRDDYRDYLWRKYR
jgi:hypothetical protein